MVERLDRRIQFLGGRWATFANSFPYDAFDVGRSVHYTREVSAYAWAGTVQSIEFVLRGNGFGFDHLGNGTGGGMAIYIDGVRTNSQAYTLGSNGDGALRRTTVTLPDSSTARRIRLDLPWRPVGPLQLAAGATLLDATPVNPSSLVVIGDSITEGAGATQPWNSWALLAGRRLGINDVHVSGVGGTGYLKRGGSNFLNLRQRIDDVLEAVDGGPPDMVAIAGGLNDNDLPPEQVGVEAEAYFRALRAGAPEMVIVVFGPFAGYPGYENSSLPAIRDAIFAAAARVGGIKSVDVSRWVTPDTRDTIFRVRGADGPHPMDTGHALYAQLAEDAIRRLFDRL